MTPSKAQARMIPATQPERSGAVDEVTAAVRRGAEALRVMHGNDIRPQTGAAYWDWAANAVVAVALDVEEIAAMLADHYPANVGECICGGEATWEEKTAIRDKGPAADQVWFEHHTATALHAAILGGAA